MFTGFLGKKILVTGNTGFKGTWLSLWLSKCGASVYGLSSNKKGNSDSYRFCIPHIVTAQFSGSITSKNFVEEIIFSIKPDFVFHLAAQPFVPYSFENPYETFDTNIFGTINILETLRKYEKDCTVVMVTSDTHYASADDGMGGSKDNLREISDPYNASKIACEVVISSYAKSYFNVGKTKIAIARSGNVIGGGDFSPSRLVPDCILSWKAKKSVKIRNATFTRPWQHVLESVYGYLTLAEFVYSNKLYSGVPFNFGPYLESNINVAHLVSKLYEHFNESKSGGYFVETREPFSESSALTLNIEKTLALMNWKPVLSIDESIRMTADWYKAYFQNPENVLEITEEQLGLFVKKIQEQT